MNERLKIGLPRMHVEEGEKRDFLPEFVAGLIENGAEVFLEEGYGSGMNLKPNDYLKLAPTLQFASREQVYQQDYVLIIRFPANADVERMRPGACLITMVHYPTRPERVQYLRTLGIEVISLDSIKDDSGRRVVENLRSVAWNGIEVAFQVLQQNYPTPGFNSHQRAPVRVTQLGSGAVGMHVMQAAIRYGDVAFWQAQACRGIPGVQVGVLDYDTTSHENIMISILSQTDLLVDATQRPNPALPVIPNDWIAWLPQHAVLLDLSVDPYDCTKDPPYVKGIEGIPQGNLDQYIFEPGDPAFNKIPSCFSTKNRRTSVSCYSWPGIHPRECMRVYGNQLRPLMRNLIQKGGVHCVDPKGKFFERALCRALLSNWRNGSNGPGS